MKVLLPLPLGPSRPVTPGARSRSSGWSATWCCTSWDKPRGTIRFKHPVALPTGAAARAAAAAARPPEIPEKRACYGRDCDASGLQK